ncbi:2-amino-4-hydroxy-6-hydroxymethyldihydropteridine diphosphokinase [Hoyosella rhizosphaerae]|uniref:2-amino-4-hydroxy-6-hydroxymethyldihydropteridine diphosphokinase n=1 Tax=Hoyosella rhizosphaerae TaxID=1755582 RepID=A0A916UKF7_9ACTN|nr:2-amino-4-hydroxy-6-hydroxymethyldihydropteridine diphosphokinase [Hoyosella rhizosphaerae]MBN4925320.1 2-amino-4-hydroxy-6-hydroxymethyldihydropteridine diphosphokinase [Hoyosella rhizosphaerae]GGC76236.1 2-amino-4-hydroxy-6-hydroxymethyldihydropteridine diphosphokinase [Hoyosella rhizosphaerae]
MTEAVLSIGSNQGDRLGHLSSVVESLGERCVSVSSVYVTPPWGGVEQPDFLNAIIIASDPAWGPWDWLRFGQECERRADRVREVRWGPRTLDVDVIACTANGQGVVSAHPDLVLPHPRAHLRAFVLVPWAEVQPTAELHGRTISDVLADLEDRNDVRRFNRDLGR